MLNVFNVNV